MTALKSKSVEAAEPAASDNSFTVVAVGEMMVTRPFSMRKEPEFVGILDLMRKADLCYGHLEMNIGAPDELKWTPRGAANRCSYMIADPRIARDLSWAGVDCVSLAHNHSFDWGPEGIRSTIKHCEENDIAHAGVGENLEVARAPGYFEIEKMRCAIVSLASGNNPYEWAGLPKAEIPGRPGVNPLRVTTRYEVDHESAEQLRAVGKKLGVLSDRTATSKVFNITPHAGVGVGVGSAGFAFVDGDKFDITSTGHLPDIVGNLRSIDEAYKMADFVIVAHHNSTSEGSRGENPSAFAVDFARKAIDAGADVYFGHGWHTFLGIEIYKGKPIIYGMGDFFMEEYLLHRVPADSYESYGIEADKLLSANPSAELHGGAEDEDWTWGAVYELKFADGALSEIRLHPCDVGMDFSTGKGILKRFVGRGPNKYIDGIPHLATGANAQNILQRLQQRCALRGTKLEIRDGIGIITI